MSQIHFDTVKSQAGTLVPMALLEPYEEMIAL